MPLFFFDVTWLLLGAVGYVVVYFSERAIPAGWFFGRYLVRGRGWRALAIGIFLGYITFCLATLILLYTLVSMDKGKRVQ